MTNWYDQDPNLQALLRRHLGQLYDWAAPRLSEAGALIGGQVNANAMRVDRPEGRPRLLPYDREGNDISQVIYSAEHLENMRLLYPLGLVGYNHFSPPGLEEPVPYVYTMALGYLVCQADVGFYCPTVLTAAAAHILSRYADPVMKEAYLPLLGATDPDLLQTGATFLTEKTGGSDVGAIESMARLVNGEWRITGEKWFASNADAPLALVLARAEGDSPGTRGLSLFLVPRTLPDGSRNTLRIRRLKEKLGTHSVATGEVLLESALGYLVGEQRKGFKYMVEGLNLSRLANAIGSVAVMRRAFCEATEYAHQRVAFGRTIDNYPMVQETLVQMLLEVEANAALTFQTAAFFDAAIAAGDQSPQRRLMRLFVPLAKYRTGEKAVEIASEAVELLGGNGYVEEYITPRLLRDAQVTTVWEGTANILALDLLQVLRKDSGAFDGYCEEVERRLAMLSGGALDSLADAVAVGLAQVRKAISYLMQQDEEYVTLHAKRLADLMVELFTAALLAEEAAVELASTENARKAVMARLYIEKYLRPPVLRGVTSGDRRLLRLFRPLIAYGHITLAEAEGL